MGDVKAFWFKFWGVRGTVPCPGPKTLRYGGNTACIEVRCGERRLIFDAGTGLRGLGHVMSAVKGPVSADLFLTHTHMDHINGLPFFRPAYAPDNQFRIWAGHLLPQGKRIEHVLKHWMEPAFFPVPIETMHSCVGFEDFMPGVALDLGDGITVRTGPLNHPGGATGYRIEFDNRAACIITDTEHIPGTIDETVVELVQDSQLFVYDATYTEDEFPKFITWGHSTWEQGIKLRQVANSGAVVTYHHEPSHDDEFMDLIARKMRQADPMGIVAREGMVLDI